MFIFAENEPAAKAGSSVDNPRSAVFQHLENDLEQLDQLFEEGILWRPEGGFILRHWRNQAGFMAEDKILWVRLQIPDRGIAVVIQNVCKHPFRRFGNFMVIQVLDKPGVLGAIATEFGNAQVSLRSVVQTNSNVEEHAEIVVITHKVKHKNILLAEEKLKTLSVVDEICSLIRVED